MDSIGRAASDFNDNSVEEGNYFLMALPQPVRCGSGPMRAARALRHNIVSQRAPGRGFLPGSSRTGSLDPSRPPE